MSCGITSDPCHVVQFVLSEVVREGLLDLNRSVSDSGELGGIRIAIDVSAWQITKGGVYGILCTRPDGRRWPLVTEMLDGWLTAVLPAECTDRPGTYEYTATWVKAGQMSISRSYRAIILGGGILQPPGRLGTPDWAREIYLKAEIAHSSMEAAVAAKTAAEAAQEAADTAPGNAEDAQEAAEAARDRAEAAATLAQEHSMGFSYASGVLTLTPLTDD